MSRDAIEHPGVPVGLSLKKPSPPIMRVSRGIGPKKIRTKFFLAFFILFVIISAFIFFYFPERVEIILKSEIEHEIKIVEQVVSQVMTSEVMLSKGARVADLLAEVIKSSNSIIYAVVEDSNENILAAVNLERALKTGYQEASSHIDLSSPDNIISRRSAIESGGELAGQIFLGFSFPQLGQQIKNERKLIGLISTAVIMFGGLFSFLMSSIVTRPLVHITRTAERVAKGDLKQRARVYSRDEIGSLARAVNSMLDVVERANKDMETEKRSLEERIAMRSIELEREISERLRVEKELKLIKLELEKRVTSRTEELSRVNEALQGKIMETTRSRSQLEHTLERLAKALEGTVDAMSLTIEMRDLYTAGHQRRVASLAVAMAEAMNLQVDQIEGLKMAGIIHDIGKIAMPAEILTKPARLTKVEFQMMKEHPRVGYDILKKIEFPWPVAQIILQHHERMDGSGYPDGLSGDAILLEARILAVADVVEALSSHRPYRPAFGLDKAMDEIRRGRGVRYDLQAVDACLKIFRDRKFNFKKEIDIALFQ